MRIFTIMILLTGAGLLAGGCVSRTVTSEKGFGESTTEKKIIWIWEDEYRNPK